VPERRRSRRGPLTVQQKYRSSLARTASTISTAAAPTIPTASIDPTTDASVRVTLFRTTGSSRLRAGAGPCFY
jgi:hypothetical protein